jgi:hypothetical protein
MNKRTMPEYHAWQHMRARCNNPKHKSFKNYGGRGIAVCKRWDSFAAFLADMGLRPSPKHSLERKNNDRHYSPSNCKWATKIEQVNNTRVNRRITFRGRTLTVSQWAKEIGIKPNTLHCRLVQYGWPPSRALSPEYGRSRWH